MGVKNLFKLLPSENVRLRTLAGSRIAIDASNAIYRAAHGLGGKSLTTKDGKETHHIKIIMQIAAKYLNNSITPIFVFDGAPPVEKYNELAKRAEQRTADSFRLRAADIAEIKTVLLLMGVSIAQSNDGFDAEHTAAVMNADGIVDYVLSGDADVLLFGGVRQLRHLQKNSDGKRPRTDEYQLFDMNTITSTMNLTREDLVLIGLHLGTDFAPKTNGIGIASVIAKRNTELSEEQIKAQQLFNKRPPIPDIITDNDDLEVRKNNIISIMKSLEFNPKMINSILAVMDK